MSEENKVKRPSWLVPFAWVPVILFLSWSIQLSVKIQWGGPFIIIPLAAWLGASYGRNGFRAIILGGLLLPFGLNWGNSQFAMNLDVYLIALLFSWIASSNRPLLNWVPKFQSKAFFYAAFFCL